MHTKLRRWNRNEVLLSNRIDTEFNRMILPLNILQQITFAQKYRIRDKFITSNDNFINFVAFFILICIIAVNSYQFLITEPNKIFSNLLQIVIQIFGLLIEPGFILINFVYSVLYSNLHVTLLLKLQRLAKFTKYSKYKDYIIGNWIGIVGVISYHFFLIIILYISYGIFLCSLIIMLLINSNLFYTFRFVNLLTKNVVLWTDNIKQLDETFRIKTEEGNDIIHLTKRCVELFNYYKDILEAFCIVKKTFEILVRKSC